VVHKLAFTSEGQIEINVIITIAKERGACSQQRNDLVSVVFTVVELGSDHSYDVFGMKLTARSSGRLLSALSEL
jgi:hypothetical protein